MSKAFKEVQIDDFPIFSIWLRVKSASGCILFIILDFNSNTNSLTVSVKATHLDQFANSLVGLFTFLFAN
jgi:hypothetical protein